MATRLRPLTLSAAHYFYLVATLLLLGGALGIVFEHGIREFYAEHVTAPALGREFGFTWQHAPSGAAVVITSVAAGGVFDRVGIRADDDLYRGLADLLHALDEARRDRRVELVFTRKDQGPNPFRCAWIDMKDLRTHPAKRAEAVGHGEAEFQVRASLVMMWIPKCCAFDLAMSGTHQATLALTEPLEHEPATRTERFSVSQSGWNDIRDAVRMNEFFDLPDEVGDWPIDAPVRTLCLTRGDKSHTTRIGDCSQRKDDAVKRACAVWDAVTRQIPFAEVTER